jgi:hypothetical protein
MSSIVGMILAAALAGEGAPSKVPPQKAEKTQEVKKVCVKEAQMGSLFERRICATPEEWERRRLNDAAEMQRMNDRGDTSR